MGSARFSLPESLEETTDLLNATQTWKLTLTIDGAKTKVIDGDQLMFTANNAEEATAFLAGCFLATFSGKSLAQIREELRTNSPGKD